MEGRYSIASNSSCGRSQSAHLWDYAKEVELDDGVYSEVVCVNCATIDRVMLRRID